MIRVVYTWEVSKENFKDFLETWRSTTNYIHENVKGALGSFMLRSPENQSEVVTIAKWESYKSWKNFFSGDNPEEMKAMRELGTRVSVEVFDEIEDQSK